MHTSGSYLAPGSDALILCDADGTILEIAPQAEAMFALPRATLIGKNLGALVSTPCGLTAIEAILASESLSAHRRGETFEVTIEVRPLTIATTQLFSIRLHETSESIQARPTLLHARKLEAIGQLAGGIAHDFNNLLTVIIASLDAVHGRLSGDTQVRVGHALAAADSGAALIKQLLAFSRKQVLSPVACDLAGIAVSTAEMLRRTLGAEFKISVHCQGDVWRAQADARQVESALLNMAVNARDAMPNGGRLHMEVENVQLDEFYAAGNEVSAGDYVMIAVSDNGTGMDRETLAQIFEPFFTTKEAGKGSGLGLSMIYGFAKQSGGHLKAYSEPGEGTTIRLYLPRDRGDAPESSEEAPTPDISWLRGNETILVVEDDPQVRSFAVSFLRDLGYQVFETSDGHEAIDVIDDQEGVDLVFTDIVLPSGLGGRSVGLLAQQKRPRIKVLYTSGHTERALFDRSAVENGANFLAKPYRGRDLAIRIRTIFDGAVTAKSA